MLNGLLVAPGTPLRGALADGWLVGPYGRDRSPVQGVLGAEPPRPAMKSVIENGRDWSPVQGVSVMPPVPNMCFDQLYEALVAGGTPLSFPLGVAP